MSPYRKNFLVGVVVLGGLITLGWMILQFGDAPIRLVSNNQIRVEFVTARAEGLSEGSAITFRGVTVGRIGRIERQPDNQSVRIEGFIDRTPPLPANLHAYIRSAGFIGGTSTISLQLPPEQAPQGELAEGQVIQTQYVGFQALPPEYTELAVELRLAAQQFRESGLIEHLDQTVRQATRMIESLNTIVADPEIQADLKAAVANIRQTSETATNVARHLESFSAGLEDLSKDTHATIQQAHRTINRAEGVLAKTETHIDRIGEQIDERLVQIAKLLNTFQAISNKIDQGKGTAGALVNDRRLYESLLLTSQQLNTLVRDLNRLIEQWEQEGATLRLR